MSNPEDRVKHSKRIQQKEVSIAQQVKIAKQHGLTEQDKALKEPHRFVKHHAMDCGQPGCIMCGNPRKTFKELTAQEKRLYQDKFYQDND